MYISVMDMQNVTSVCISMYINKKVRWIQLKDNPPGWLVYASRSGRCDFQLVRLMYMYARGHTALLNTWSSSNSVYIRYEYAECDRCMYIHVYQEEGKTNLALETTCLGGLYKQATWVGAYFLLVPFMHMCARDNTA